MSAASEREIVAQAASRHGIPASVLWGVFGAESSWGKGGSNWFGLVDVPRTGSFAGDANASAETIARLDHESGGNMDAALRRYSGGSYGLEHVQQLAKQHPDSGHKYLEIFGVKQYGLGLPGEGVVDKLLGIKLAPGGASAAAGETVKEVTGAASGLAGGVLSGAGELVLKGVLLLAGAVLVIYGIMVAVRPPDRALSLPKMPAVVPV